MAREEEVNRTADPSLRVKGLTDDKITEVRMRKLQAMGCMILTALLFTGNAVRGDESANRAKATLQRMKSIATAAEAYITDTNKAPEAISIEALAAILSPTYIREFPLRDGWDTPFRYVRTGTASFRVIGAGSDRKFDERSWDSNARTKDLAADAVFTFTSPSQTGVFERVWIDAAGQPLVMTDAEAEELYKPYVDAELEKMKKMSGEQSASYFRTSATSRTLDLLAWTLDKYRMKNGRYPAGTSMKDLEKAVFPEFTAEVPSKDAWGTELRYEAPKDGSSYRLVSAGADHVFDESSWNRKGVLSSTDEDAVVVNGEVVRFWTEETGIGEGPEGAARRALNPGARQLLAQADERIEAGDYAAALTAYVEAVKIDKRVATPERLGRYEPPIGPYVTGGRTPTADELREIQQIEKAKGPRIAALRQHLELHPDDRTAMGNLVALLGPAEGESFLATMLQRGPKDPELYALRALTRVRQGRDGEALDDYEKAAQLDPGNAERYYVAAVTAYEATKRTGLSVEQRRAWILRALSLLDRADALRSDYFESLVYRNILLRAQAELETDPSRKQKLMSEAEAVRARAVSLRQKK